MSAPPRTAGPTVPLTDRQQLLHDSRASGDLDQLPFLQRQAFELWCAGAGYKRVAAMLGIQPSTARGRIDRAQARLNRKAAA